MGDIIDKIINEASDNDEFLKSVSDNTMKSHKQ